MTLGVRPVHGGAAAAFCRDVRTLVDHARNRPQRRTGLALLWLDAWDGTISLPYPSLDELYVDICRRVRLFRSPRGNVEGIAAGSKCARVAMKELYGKTLDPWAPMKVDQSSSHKPSKNGFGYRQMTNLLDDSKIILPVLAVVDSQNDVGKLAILASALVRGEGKTEGLHRRIVQTSQITEDDIFAQIPLDNIGKVAGKRTKQAGDAARILRAALLTLVQGGPDNPRLDDTAGQKKIDPWDERFDREVDRIFFDKDFWAQVAERPINHLFLWRKRLQEIASAEFEQAADAASYTQIRRLRARTKARQQFDRAMGNWVGKAEHGE